MPDVLTREVIVVLVRVAGVVCVDDLDVVVAEYQAHAHEALMKSIIETVVIMLVLVIIGSVAAFLAGGKITQPITKAANQMIRMSNRDFTENEAMEEVRGSFPNQEKTNPQKE